MSSSRMSIAATVLLAALASCSSVEDAVPIPLGSCGLVGCVSGAQLSFRVATTTEVLLASTIEMCRNSQCSRATPTSVPTGAGEGSGARLVGAIDAAYTVWGAQAGRFVIEAWAPGTGAYPYGLADGDRYELRLIDGGGARIAETTTTVTYVESYPNGKACDLQPCRAASHDGGDFTAPTPSDGGTDAASSD